GAGAGPGVGRSGRGGLAHAVVAGGGRRGDFARGRRPAARRRSLSAGRATRGVAARARTVARRSPPSRARPPRATPRPPAPTGARAALRRSWGVPAERT